MQAEEGRSFENQKPQGLELGASCQDPMEHSLEEGLSLDLLDSCKIYWQRNDLGVNGAQEEGLHVHQEALIHPG